MGGGRGTGSQGRRGRMGGPRRAQRGVAWRARQTDRRCARDASKDAAAQLCRGSTGARRAQAAELPPCLLQPLASTAAASGATKRLRSALIAHACSPCKARTRATPRAWLCALTDVHDTQGSAFSPSALTHKCSPFDSQMFTSFLLSSSSTSPRMTALFTPCIPRDAIMHVSRLGRAVKVQRGGRAAEGGVSAAGRCPSAAAGTVAALKPPVGAGHGRERRAMLSLLQERSRSRAQHTRRRRRRRRRRTRVKRRRIERCASGSYLSTICCSSSTCRWVRGPAHTARTLDEG